jgi:virginiamycin B lyase
MDRTALAAARLVVLSSSLLALGPAAGGPLAAQASVAAPVTEWTVPWPRTRPRDPAVDAQGRVWFVGQEGNYVAFLDPRSGRFRRYEIDPGTFPHNLAVDARGAVWFTGNRNGRLVKLDPATGRLTTYAIPDAKVRDPHTMLFDRGGNAWFTAQEAGVVGRRDAATGEMRLWRVGDDTRPYGIALDSRGRVWFDEFGTNRIGMVDPRTMQLRHFPLPDQRSRPRRIAITSDDAVWYGDYTRGYLGRLDPATGRVEEFALPAGSSALPYAMTVDDRDHVWVAETGVRPNRLVAFDPRARAFTETATVEGGDAPNTVRHMIFHRPTRTIWYGTDLNTIGRATVPPPAPEAPRP